MTGGEAPRISAQPLSGWRVGAKVTCTTPAVGAPGTVASMASGNSPTGTVISNTASVTATTTDPGGTDMSASSERNRRRRSDTDPLTLGVGTLRTDGRAGGVRGPATEGVAGQGGRRALTPIRYNSGDESTSGGRTGGIYDRAHHSRAPFVSRQRSASGSLRMRSGVAGVSRGR